jgi:hypothetical protein
MALLLAPRLATGQEDLLPRCLSCVEASSEATVNLLLRRDSTEAVTIAWESGQDAARQPSLVLHAGNPMDPQGLANRGPLTWEVRPGGGSQARAVFRADELGSGTFVTVVVAPGRDGGVIRDWRAWRLMTLEGRAHLADPPPVPPGYSLHVTPWLLQAETGHGMLPPRRGNALAWHSVVALQGNVTDVDLDGQNTGIAGLGIQVAQPWHTSAGEDWKTKLLALVTGNPGHKVRFEDFEWVEQPDRTLAVPGVKVFLRNFYSVVTLYTRATHRRFSETEAGGHWLIGSPDYFSHETTARLDPPDGAPLWSSYDERQHGRDPALLRLLQVHGRRNARIPGFGPVQRVDGDGGSARFTVGFNVQVVPWSEPEAGGNRFAAGIVGVDVVAARAGVGAIATQDGTGEGGPWCVVVGCGDKGGKRIDLHSPPAGYGLAGSPVAQLGTLSGALQLATEAPLVVERGVEPEGALPKLPRVARFGLTADLRAGLLVRKALLGPPREIYEINPYAQYVVRIAVAMMPETAMVAADVPILPRKMEHAAVIVLVQAWWEKLVDWLGSHLIGASRCCWWEPWSSPRSSSRAPAPARPRSWSSWRPRCGRWPAP